MAINKKTVVVYTDWISTFDKLSDAEAGRLIKHFFSYINDLNPEPPDRMTELLFEPIKCTLKRDLDKYEDIRRKRSIAGQSGGRPKVEEKQIKAKKANAFFDKQTKAKKADSDSVSESASVSDSDDNKISSSPTKFIYSDNQLSGESELDNQITLRPINEIANKIYNDGSMEMFIRQLDLSVNDKNTKPVLLNLLTKFLAQLKANNNMQKTEYDFRKHFQNWCRKQRLNEYLPKTETKTNNQTIEELNAKYSKKYTQET